MPQWWVQGRSPGARPPYFLETSQYSTMNSQLCGSRKYPYPPRKGFALWPPHPSGNSNLTSYIALNFCAFEIPRPPRNFQSLLWGEYGYFLEPHILQKRNTAPPPPPPQRWRSGSPVENRPLRYNKLQEYKPDTYLSKIGSIRFKFEIEPGGILSRKYGMWFSH